MNYTTKDLVQMVYPGAKLCTYFVGARIEGEGIIYIPEPFKINDCHHKESFAWQSALSSIPDEVLVKSVYPDATCEKRVDRYKNFPNTTSYYINSEHEDMYMYDLYNTEPEAWASAARLIKSKIVE